MHIARKRKQRTASGSVYVTTTLQETYEVGNIQKQKVPTLCEGGPLSGPRSFSGRYGGRAASRRRRIGRRTEQPGAPRPQHVMPLHLLSDAQPTFMKKRSSSPRTQTVLLSALLGGAAGFALGLLLAPERGQKARRRLIYQLENLAGQTGQLAQRLFRPEVTSEARRTGDALVADAQARADHIRDDIEALLEEIRAQEAAARNR